MKPLTTMSYCGNTSLPGDFQNRINASFSQTVDFAKEGKNAEALLGCDFILRLDSLFEPARRLEKQIRSDEPFDAAVFLAQAGLDAEVEAAPAPTPQPAPAPATSAAALPETPADASEPDSEKFIEFRELSEFIEFRGSVRVQLSRAYRVDVGAGWEYHLQSGLFEAVGSDLGEGGMFVNVANPQMKGSRIDFEVQFAGMGLIEGCGEVAWLCDHGSRSDHAPGIGLRFLALHGESQKEVRLTMESASRPTSLRLVR